MVQGRCSLREGRQYVPHDEWLEFAKMLWSVVVWRGKRGQGDGAGVSNGRKTFRRYSLKRFGKQLFLRSGLIT